MTLAKISTYSLLKSKMLSWCLDMMCRPDVVIICKLGKQGKQTWYQKNQLMNNLHYQMVSREMYMVVMTKPQFFISVESVSLPTHCQRFNGLYK